MLGGEESGREVEERTEERKEGKGREGEGRGEDYGKRREEDNGNY